MPHIPIPPPMTLAQRLQTLQKINTMPPPIRKPDMGIQKNQWVS